MMHFANKRFRWRMYDGGAVFCTRDPAGLLAMSNEASALPFSVRLLLVTTTTWVMALYLYEGILASQEWGYGDDLNALFGCLIGLVLSVTGVLDAAWCTRRVPRGDEELRGSLVISACVFVFYGSMMFIFLGWIGRAR